MHPADGARGEDLPLAQASLEIVTVVRVDHDVRRFFEATASKDIFLTENLLADQIAASRFEYFEI
jgi:hypothetical protein